MPRVIKADDHREFCVPSAGPLHLDDVAAKARRTILFARRQAEGIVAEAREQAEDARCREDQGGYADGLDRGRAEGLAEGRRQAAQEAREQLRPELRELIGLAKGIIAEIETARARLADRATGELLELALELAGKVVGEVSVRDPSAARANVDKVLELAGRGGQVTLKVNPAQLAHLREYCAELPAALAVGGRVELVGDQGIAPGGVRLVMGHGELDATIQTQLNNIVEALLGPREAPPWPGPDVNRDARADEGSDGRV